MPAEKGEAMSKVDISSEAVERLAKTADLFAKAMKTWQHKTQKHNEDVRDTLRAQAERIKELEATLVRHRADRPFVIGWNDGFEHGVKEAANLMRSAGAKARAAQETCSKIQRRDYETSAIVHSYAADAIAALLIEGATND